MELVFKRVRIETRLENITSPRLMAESIVCAANSSLRMLGGVALAIKTSGGKEIETEAVTHAPLPVGKAVATDAGTLLSVIVIHAPTMDAPGSITTPVSVFSATLAALKCAEKEGVRSIAIPGMGAGVGGVKPEIVAKEIIRAVRKFLDAEPKAVRRIILTDLNRMMILAWEKELKELDFS